MLEQIEAMARGNGVGGAGDEDAALQLLSTEEVAAREPAVRCVGALLSPATGIVDSHGVMLALCADAEAHGATVAYGASVAAVEALPSGRLLLRTTSCDDGGATALECDEVVNAAGHAAPVLARALRTPPTAPPPSYAVPRPRYAKGSYFGLEGPSPFRGLVYPVPQQAGLGVHATVDLGGRCRFGPDVEWVERPDDFDVDPSRAASFYAEVRKYWPQLPDGALVPDYAGVRPKLQAPGEPAKDFAVVGPREHGVRGLVHLLGIESPGLTASLALAQVAVDALGGSLDGGPG